MPAIILVLMAVVAVLSSAMPLWAVWTAEAVLFTVLLWVLSFFRDPYRRVPTGSDILLAPADGVVTDIETVEAEQNSLGVKALRIGIFLNIFNVHINRMPCAAKIEKITYKKGRYKNAMNPESARVNESNDILMRRLDEPKETLLVRQISGAIARRIVCVAKAGQDFSGGQKFGMIKFGSRTELYLPAGENAECLVGTGRKVKAGVTVCVRYSQD